MASGPFTKVVDHLHRLALSLDPDTATDGELLEGFIARRDEAAFAALVRRHGPMVLGVCRRVVGDVHEADDAFQATFFVLSRKADVVRPRDMVGNWLYGVAYRTALKARTVRQRRRAVEKQVEDMPHPRAVEQDVWLDLQPLIDQELSKLPDVYRTPVVLCDVEGRSRKDVARQLGVPEGTLSSRLARGRQMLAKRLGRRGVSLSALALGAAVTQHAAAAVPLALAVATAETAAQLATGAGVVPAAIVALMDGALKTVLAKKVMTLSALLCAAVVVGTGAIAMRTPPFHSLPDRAFIVPPSDEERLQGRWNVVALESAGRSLPLPPDMLNRAVSFEADMLHTRLAVPVDDSTESSARFKLGSARARKTIDVLVEGTKRSSGIYLLENDQLTICLVPAGRKRPRTFKTTPEDSAILFILRPAAIPG